ncbi:MAG: hypothetical protein KAI99_11540 [Cyclobacteriaceae bacterium]|nr:hypothetical protein [Cyclobacteriaceae bacterium]
MKYLNILFLSFIILFSCDSKQDSQQAQNLKKHPDKNPPAEGFNESGSDRKAIEIADKVMIAMGGRNNWDTERFFTWNFFGSRSLWWDKLNGDVRIQMHKADSTLILVNIFDGTGRVYSNGEEMNHPDSLSKYLKRGKGIWINDAYWLFMPFKLKDSGVTLTYVGEDTTQAGIAADVLQLTFEGVGNTPQNKYHVWVDRSDNLIKQWAFFRKNDMGEPNFITPWIDYKEYGSIILSGDRGKRKITNIAVLEYMDESIFNEF